MFLTNSYYINFLITSFSTANLSVSKSSISDIELAKLAFLENFDALTLASFFKSDFVVKVRHSTFFFTMSIWFWKINSCFIAISFLSVQLLKEL